MKFIINHLFLGTKLCCIFFLAETGIEVRQRLESNKYTIFYEVRVSTLEMNGKIEIFCKEIEAIKKIQAS